MRLKPITPYREYYELRPPKEKPTVGLLGVNKTIGAEAAPVLYSNNLWRVSSTIYTGRGPSSTLQAPRPVRGSKDLALWGSRAELFRHVLLVISSCDVITKSIWDLPYYGVTVDPSYATPGARTYTENQQLAQENLRRMSRAFKFEAIAQMQNLSSIILDVEGLFSSSYGGRRLEQMEKALQDFFHHLESRKVGRNPPLEVSIIGLEEEQEKAILQPFTDRITWAEKGTCWPDGRIFQRTGGTFHY